MSESDLQLKTSASAARFIEALRIIRHQVCQLSVLMGKIDPIGNKQEKQDEKA